MTILDGGYLSGASWPGVIAGLFGVLVPLFLFRQYSKLSDIPGPFLACFTRLWHVHCIERGEQNLRLIELHRKHGHFVRIAPNEVSVSHPDGIRKILLAPLPKAPWYGAWRFPDWRWQTPMGELDPKKKNERSRNFGSAYAMANLLKSEGPVDDVIGKLCDWMNQHADEKKPMDLDWFFSYAAFDNLGEIMFSKQFGFIETGTDVGSSIKDITGLQVYIVSTAFYPWIYYLFLNPLVTWLSIMPYGHIFDTVFKTIAQRRSNPDARYDCLAHWLKSHEENPARLTMKDIEGHTYQVIGAGSDTVSSCLQSFVYFIIRSPEGDHWQHIRDEITEAQHNGRCTDRVISFADAQQLPYLQACIKEALRVCCPASMGLPRTVPNRGGGVTIGGRTFAPGTILSINPWVIHHSTEIWGADAAEFHPERWLVGDVAHIAALEKYFMPWGQGYASCPGQNIAKLEIVKMAATIVRDYDIRQVNPEQEWRWKAMFGLLPHDWPVYITKVKP